MILNYSLCGDDIRLLLEEVKDLLNISFGSEGIRLVSGEWDEAGYRITKKGSEVVIQYHAKSDFCRSLLTLCKRAGEKEWTYGEKSSFEEFGVMLDISRNAVMRNDALRQFIKSVALMGYNFIGLYMEDTIEVAEEPYFGYMRGAMTAEELKEIDAYAGIFGIELRAYIQTLAHVNQITRYEEYQAIIDTDDILLAGEERTYQLLECLIKTVSENISSRRINIGMDEAHMVGLGKYLDKHGYSNRFHIMEEHLKRVLAICDKYGLQAEMWSDMFFRLAFGGEYYIGNDRAMELPEIPPGVELVYWDYYSCDSKRYDRMLKNHLRLTDKVGFAGGAWKWTGFAPHNDYSLEIGKAAIEACRENNIKSVVITAWGDNGAEASSFSILPALYADAEYNFAGSIGKTNFEYLTGMAFDDFMKIDLPNLFPKLSGSGNTENDEVIAQPSSTHNNASKYLLYNDVLLGTFDSVIPEGIAEFYQNAALQLQKLSDNKSYGYLFDTQAKLCKVLQMKADLGKRIKKAYDKKDIPELKSIRERELPKVLDALEAFYKAFGHQWLKENKAFGFEVQCIRLGGLQKRLEYAGQQLSAYVSGEIDRIEELEAGRREFSYMKDTNFGQLSYNLWHDIVSPSNMG